MFGAWAMNNINGEDLTKKERAPPPDPTPVRLPTTGYTSSSPVPALQPSTWQALYKLCTTLRQPRDVTPDLLDLLNVHVVPDTSFADLLPEPSPFDAFKELDGTDRSDLCERMFPMVFELGHSNDRAFKSLLRLAEGREKVTLSYARRFWSGLEHMSHYWDTSLDQYYDVPDVDDREASATIPGTDIRPPAKSDDSAMDHDFMSAPKTRYSFDDVTGEMVKLVEEKPEPEMKRVYKGRRTGTGREMQEEFRDEMLKGFIEAVAWAHGCQVYKPMVYPRLAIGTMLVPMKQNLVVGRSPKERVAARRGVLEGPVLGLLGRGMMGWWIDGPWPELEGEKAEVYDLLREVGAMLELAQERAREGKKETRPGAGKWWTSKRRWGGGPGGSMGYEDGLQKDYYIEDGHVKCVKAKKRPLSEGDAEGDKIMTEPVEEGAQEEKITVPNQGRKKSGRESKKGGAANAKPAGALKRWNLMADRWKLVQPGSSLWDDQRVYMRIGKEKGKQQLPPQPQPQSPPGELPPEMALETDTFDNVYLVSSMNHHISVLRMRVSDRYLAWLQAGNGGSSKDGKEEESMTSRLQSLQAQGMAGAGAAVLQMWRTKWYDLFVPEERVEAQKGLWSIMAWLMKRDSEEDGGEGGGEGGGEKK